MRAFRLPRDGAFFVAASLVAGLGHYAYQIIASRRLSGFEFAGLSAWHAHLSFGFVLAGLAQYAANFHPWTRARLKPALLVINVAAALTVATWWMGTDPLGLATGVAVCTLAILAGWVTGQAQIRLDFEGLAWAQLAVAAGKLALPALVRGGVSVYTLAIGACYLPGLAVLSPRLWRARDASAPGARAWAAPIVLSIAANVIPQFDLLVTRHSLSAAAFDDFARASLFYKGIYFAVFIFAQWLLPRQIRGDRSGARLTWTCAFAASASLGLAVVSPLVARWIFAWAVAPDPWLVFLACVRMSLLTVTFLNIQSACAAGTPARGLWPLLGLGLEAGAQILLGLTVFPYLALTITTQAVSLWAGWWLGLRFHSGRRA